MNYLFFTDDPYPVAYDHGIQFLDKIPIYPEMTAVMFDIDDTLLKVNPGNILSPIQPMIDLLNECIKRKLIIIIITARDVKYIKQTIDDLNEFKIQYNYLYMRESPRDDAYMFKDDAKKLFFENKITIIMSIGDNELDVYGKYGGHGIKLPSIYNPRMYTI